MDNSKGVALVSTRRPTELIGIRKVITDEKGNKSHMSITFIQHSLKRHSPFHPAGSLWNAVIVTLSDGCTLRIISQQNLISDNYCVQQSFCRSSGGNIDQLKRRITMEI